MNVLGPSDSRSTSSSLSQFPGGFPTVSWGPARAFPPSPAQPSDVSLLALHEGGFPLAEVVWSRAQGQAPPSIFRSTQQAAVPSFTGPVGGGLAEAPQWGLDPVSEGRCAGCLLRDLRLVCHCKVWSAEESQRNQKLCASSSP